MPDRRRHRGPHPGDAEKFAPTWHGTLCEAVAHLSWLLSRGYADRSSLKLVGDRFQLTARQRIGVRRCACSNEERDGRRTSEVDAAALAGEPLFIDGYNVLTTIEAALAGGVLLLGRDGCLRDMASMHGSYRRVEETAPALEHLGMALVRLGVKSSHWLLDRPVSNSGRLATEMRALARDRGWAWEIDLVGDPDGALCRTDAIVASADRLVLDGCKRWFNLARHVADGMDRLAGALDCSTPH